MKKMKKVLAVMLAIVLTLSCMSILGYSSKKEFVPTIIIPGLFQSEVFYYENGEVATDANGAPLAAPFFVNVDGEFIINALTKALIPVTKMFITQEDKDQLAAKEVSKILGQVLLGKQQSNAKGELITDVRATYYNGSVATISEEQRTTLLGHFPVEEYFDIAGMDNLYVFNYVSTGNMIKTATDLYNYIQFVKKDSGSEKVNIVPVSQGGSIANALMKIYAEKGISLSKDIHRIIFTVPALDGAALIGDAYRHGFTKDPDVLYTTMMPSVIGYENYLGYVINILMRLMPNTDVDNLLDIIVQTLVMDYMRYSTLMWGLCPTADYPACREIYLSDPELAEIRKQADWYYDAQLKSQDYILKAVKDGVQVFDICDSNTKLYQLAVSHDEINADGMIHLSSTSMGAYSTGVYEKLPADYVPARNNCTDPKNHNHTDPEGVVDVCTGLLPETTFYFSGQNHAETASNDVIMSLIIALLTDEDFTSVHSYPDKYPQFNYCRITKQLRADVNEMRDYDTSTLSSEDAKELKEAIAQVDKMIANKVVNPEETAAASDRFYNSYNKIADNDVVMTRGFNRALYVITKAVSDILYAIYGEAAFSEMAFKPIIDVCK